MNFTNFELFTLGLIAVSLIPVFGDLIAAIIGVKK